MTNPAPYHEDTIAGLITQVLQMHVDLCYIPLEKLVFPVSSTAIASNEQSTGTQPRTARHSFSPEVYSFLRQIPLSEGSISLLERIPYLEAFADNREYPVFQHDAGLITYDERRFGRSHMEESRWPGLDSDQPEEKQTGKLDENEIALTVMLSRNGVILILNIAENTIREYSWYFNDPKIPSDPTDPRRNHFPFPDNTLHYKNFEAVHAPDFLHKWMEDLRTLKQIPWREGCGAFLWFEGDAEDEYKNVDPASPLGKELEALAQEGIYPGMTYKKLKYIMQKEYGWPDKFQKERWAKDHEEIWKKLEEEEKSIAKKFEEAIKRAQLARVLPNPGQDWSQLGVLGALSLLLIWLIVA